MPPSTLDETDRTVLLEIFSIYDVFYQEHIELGYSEEDILDYLINTEVPVYFNESGFVAAGESPSSAYYFVSIIEFQSNKHKV